MRHYEPPPNNDLGSELPNKRKARHFRTRRALQSEDERTTRLAMERDEKWLKRADIREGLYQPKYKAKKSDDDEKHNNVCLDKPGGKLKLKPKKEKIEITGKGGFPLHACANFTDAKYVSTNLSSNLAYNPSLPFNGQGRLPYNVQCHNLDGRNTTHKFSAGFRNVRPYPMQQICPTEEILSCEIQINGISVGNIGRCSHATAEMSSSSGYLLITHHFSINHSTTPWGWYERFTLNLLYGPLPNDVSADIESKLNTSRSKRIENFEYGLISRNGLMLSSIQFMDVQFYEASMKWGDPLHIIAWKTICERKEGRSVTEKELAVIQKELSTAAAKKGRFDWSSCLAEEIYKDLYDPFRRDKTKTNYTHGLYDPVICCGLEGALEHFNGKSGKVEFIRLVDEPPKRLVYFDNEAIRPCKVPTKCARKIGINRGHTNFTRG